MAYRFANFWQSVLSQPILAGDTTIYIPPADAALLPALGVGDRMRMTLWDNATGYEIVELTANASGTLTVIRARESSVAIDWPAGSYLSNAITAELLQLVLTSVSSVQYTGTATNSGDDYTVTGVAVPPLAGGEEVYFNIPSTNTTNAPRLRVTDGVSPTAFIPLVDLDGDPLEPGDLAAGYLAIVSYNSADTEFRLVTATAQQVYAEAVNHGPVSHLNHHPNPRFDRWRNGTSFNTPASGTETADGVYPIYDGSIGTFSISRQAFTPGQNVVPGYPEFFLRWDHTVAGSGSTRRTIRIPVPRVTTFESQKALRSVWLRADASRSVTARIVQHFGTGGSPSADVVSESLALSLTSDFQEFQIPDTLASLTGKTFGTAGDHAIWLELDLPVNITMTIDVAQDQFESGEIATLRDGFFPLDLRYGGLGGSFPSYSAALAALGGTPLTYLDTDGTLAANSDTKIATQKAVKTYADALLALQDAMVFKGVIDCSANPNYPAADRGHTYRVSVAGKIGGASGPNVQAGDLLTCMTDGTAAGDEATVGAQWTITQANIDGAVIGPASTTDLHLAQFSGTTGKLLGSGIPTSTFVLASAFHANGLTLVGQTFANMRASLDLEPGTDFYSISAANAAFISSTGTTAAGLSILNYTDPNADRLIFWDDSAGDLVSLALPPSLSISNTDLQQVELLEVALSDESNTVTSGTNKFRMVLPYDIVVTGVGASCSVAGTGITIDVNDGVTSILSTKITIDSGELTTLTAATPAVISDTTIAAGAVISWDIDSIAGTYNGVKAWILFRRSS